MHSFMSTAFYNQNEHGNYPINSNEKLISGHRCRTHNLYSCFKL